MKKKYIIWAPPLSKSNGVKALYSLYKILRERGYESYIFSNEGPQAQDFLYIKTLTKEIKEKDIIVYPEIVSGNPLQFNNVVRYILYYPPKHINVYKTDLCFTWKREFFHDNTPILFLSGLDRSLFYDAHLPKIYNCVFIHKKGKFRDLKEVDGCVEINMQYPASRKALAELLQKTNILYSYDDCSLLLDEASLCGAKVKIITENNVIDYSFQDDFNIDLFNSQINFFIKTTQSMNNIVIDKYLIPKKIKIKIFKYYVYNFLYKFTKLKIIEKKLQKTKNKLIQYGRL